MPRSRSRTQAEKRLAMAEDSPETPNGSLAGLGDLADEFLPFLPGVVKTLGMAAQPVVSEDGTTVTPGDTDAAKKILDFLSRALTTRDRRGSEVLNKIAEIRKKAKEDGPAT